MLFDGVAAFEGEACEWASWRERDQMRGRNRQVDAGQLLQRREHSNSSIEV